MGIRPLPCSARKAASIIEQIGACNGRLAGMELGWLGRVWLGSLGVGIDEGLLIESANALDRACIEIVLAVKIARVSRIKPE